MVVVAVLRDRRGRLHVLALFSFPEFLLIVCTVSLPGQAQQVLSLISPFQAYLLSLQIAFCCFHWGLH